MVIGRGDATGTLTLDAPARITIPVGEPFKAATGISRATQYELIAAGEIESVLTGSGPRGRRVILVDSWLRYLKRQQQKEAARKIGAPSPNPRARRDIRRALRRAR